MVVTAMASENTLAARRSTASCSHGKRGEAAESFRHSAPLMEIVVNQPRGSGIDAGHLFEIGERRARDRFRSAETLQQRALPRRSDAADLVQGTTREFTFASRTMRADREAMRLIAQPLGEIERRIARWHVKRLAAFDEKGFAAGIAVAPLGDRDQRHAGDAKFGKDLPCRIELTTP